jgi:alkane 1-monooxygenase
MHFTIEHIYGHHKRVSTPDDPTSAPKGMTVYEFVPRSIIGSLKSAFHINALFVVCSLLGSAIFFGMIYKYWGALATGFMLLAGLGSMVMLEVINYIEHYGLRRKRLEDGTYERVNIRHSWNAPHRISNYLFFKLQRHSDHHENALKPYQTLCSYEDSPQLPHGYTVCILLAVFPSVKILFKLRSGSTLWIPSSTSMLQPTLVSTLRAWPLPNRKSGSSSSRSVTSLLDWL